MELTEENFNQKLDEMVAKYLPEGKTLRMNGIQYTKMEKNKKDLRDFPLSSIAKINFIMKQIPKHYQKHSPLGKKYWNTQSSYASKHYLSDMIRKEFADVDNYCSNGEFIFAMWLLDYEMKPCEDDNDYHWAKNAIFNCSHRDLTKITCECGFQYTKSCRRQHDNSKRHNLIMTAMHLKDTDTEFGDYVEEAIKRLS